MNELMHDRPKRKVLSLKKEKESSAEKPLTPSRYLKDELSHYMVWCPGADMPKKVYGPNEKSRALWDAQFLTSQKGMRFYVMRTWRGFDPVEEKK